MRNWRRRLPACLLQELDMRLLAIGDIHGCSTALRALLDTVAPQPDDLVVTLGDYVARGPDTRGVLDRLVELRESGRLIALRGNHEVMMLQARDNPLADNATWLSCGGRQTLSSYGIDTLTAANLERIPAAHW